MNKETSSIDIIADEAADWFEQNRDPKMPLVQREAFQRWLAESPKHVQEYLGIAETYALLSAVEEWPALVTDDSAGMLPGPLDHPNVIPFEPKLHTRRIAIDVAPKNIQRPRLRWWKIVRIAVVAAMLGALAVLIVRFNLILPKSYETLLAEQRLVSLEDGSTIRLNTQSKIRVRYSESERRIELLYGEAFFKVHHDTTRPFNVVTRNGTVRAVGTAFTVRSSGELEQVAVIEGKVLVTAARASPALPGSKASPKEYLIANQSAGIVNGAVFVNQSKQASQRATGWLRGQLVFTDERLDVVIREFNRYTVRQITVPEGPLSGLRISGVFRIDKPETLLDYLRHVQGVKVEELDGTLELTQSSKQARKNIM